MPAMVVPEASKTGRSRLPQALLTLARVGPRSPVRLSISSTNTMQFLISMPARLRSPKDAGKVKGMDTSKRLRATPPMTMGTVSQTPEAA